MSVGAAAKRNSFTLQEPALAGLPQTDSALQPSLQEARSLMRAGRWVLLVGLLPLAAWMALAPLASAVVAPAFVKVDLNRRPVQHAEGGIVREVRVRDGQQVAEGETLLVLGDVGVDADLNRWDYRVAAERISITRLEAEQALAPDFSLPADLAKATESDPRLAELLKKERALFAARRDAMVGQIGLLRAQREKVAQEAAALKAQIAQAAEALALQKQELATNRNLLKDGFISATRITQLEAGIADYSVKLEERRSELARAEQRMVDNDLRARSLESEYRQQASDQLKATQARLSELQQEQRKSRDAAKRQVIVAPVAGEVMDLKFNTPGAVIAPREPIADIVPSAQRLVVEARVRPEDINRVYRDQAAEIRFTAFAYRTTKLVDGKVFYVSADRLVDRATNVPYYVVNIEADAGSLAKAGDLKLLAGMPAEVYIKGEERTPLAYLLEPLTQVVRRAGRER
jgi:HlyD family type I secretion membrane fusion protein